MKIDKMDLKQRKQWNYYCLKQPENEILSKEDEESVEMPSTNPNEMNSSDYYSDKIQLQNIKEENEEDIIKINDEIQIDKKDDSVNEIRNWMLESCQTMYSVDNWATITPINEGNKMETIQNEHEPIIQVIRKQTDENNTQQNDLRSNQTWKAYSNEGIT